MPTQPSIQQLRAALGNIQRDFATYGSLDAPAVMRLLILLVDKVETLDEEMQTLRREQHTTEHSAPRKTARFVDVPPVAPPMQRPLDYWAEHVPDYGDGLSVAEIERHLAKPRVRAEDLPLEPVPPKRRLRYQQSPVHINRKTILLIFVVIALLFLTLLERL